MYIIAVVCTVLAGVIRATGHGTCWDEINQRLCVQSDLSRAEMEAKFKEHSVVPDVLDDVPPQLAEVNYA